MEFITILIVEYRIEVDRLESILVLLSTYNGEKYLEEQLNSLKSQIGVKVDILVRDDGSKDSTIDILNEWQREGGLSWYSGNNLKAAKSFMNLVNNAPDYNYYAYCDQDDVWEIDKLKIALQMMEQYPRDKELLYCSTLNIVDEKLNFLNIKQIHRLYPIGEALIRNNIVGCTMVFNRKLLETIKIHNPEYLEMHDSWTYRVCIAVGGNVVVDYIPHINYRQHENNVIGATVNNIDRLYNRFKSLYFRKNYGSLQTARELLLGYSERISEKDKKLLIKVINYKKSLKNKLILIFDRDMIHGSALQKILFTIDVLLENI